MIVHAGAGDVFPETPSVPDRESGFYQCLRVHTRKISDRGLAPEVNVKVLQLGRPIVREHPFGAGACGPADFGLADTCRCLKLEAFDRFEPICRSVNTAIGQTASTIEQQLGRDGDAETAPHRAEP